MSSLDDLLRMATAGLASDDLVTPDAIRNIVGQLRRTDLFPDVSDEDAAKVCRNIEARMNVTIELGTAIVAPDHKPWLSQARGEIDWFYWPRYREQLENDGWPKSVLTTMDRDTDKILDGLADPRVEGSWDRRGMVIGNVQSGKTANYIGLLSKAADAGYKIIIVVAGIHEMLRSQTQSRVDAGFLGWDTGRGLRHPGKAVIGVGRLNSGRRPGSFTSSISDFGVGIAGVNMPLANLNEPVVFVVKKNYKILQTLIDFLKSQGDIDQPCLVIDDEADNASINIRYSKDEVSKINELIRTVLTLYPRSSFVAYTATPFANVFIDPESDDEMLGSDLFPRDFIFSLDAPSNYFGADKVFGDLDSGVPTVLRYIDDHRDILPLKHKKELEVSELPPSLSEAISTFIVATAIRSWRDQGAEHMSMLVNVSVFRDVQRRIVNRVFDEVSAFRDALKGAAGLGPSAARENSRVRMLHEAWTNEYRDRCAWDDLFGHLLESVMRMDVIEVNSRSSESLSYDEYESGRRVIAVGGYSLSRGLTLEGLTVSYFLRNSRMYDTLMQMARWFGYRPGFEDLCRVWMTPSAAGWYAHIAESIDELRDQIRAMEARRATPREFGLMVRSHPDALMATSRSKIGTGEQRVLSLDLSTKFVETPILHADRAVLAKNREAAVELARALDAAGNPLADAERWPRQGDSDFRSYLVRDVSWEPVVEFLRSFTVYERAAVIGTDPIVRYIRDRVEYELGRWDVLFTSVRPSDKNPVTEILGVPIGCQSRTAGDSDGDELRLSSRFRVASRGVEKAGVAPDRALAAEERFLEETGKANPPDRIYRAERDRPLLIVHLLSVTGAPEALGDISNEPTAAFSLSFPTTRLEGERVEYIVNNVWLQQFLELDEEEEFDEE